VGRLIAHQCEFRILNAELDASPTDLPSTAPPYPDRGSQPLSLSTVPRSNLDTVIGIKRLYTFTWVVDRSQSYTPDDPHPQHRQFLDHRSQLTVRQLAQLIPTGLIRTHHAASPKLSHPTIDRIRPPTRSTADQTQLRYPASDRHHTHRHLKNSIPRRSQSMERHESPRRRVGKSIPEQVPTSLRGTPPSATNSSRIFPTVNAGIESFTDRAISNRGVSVENGLVVSQSPLEFSSN